MRRVLPVLLLLGLLVPGTADAAKRERVLFYDFSVYPEAVDLAVAQWNRSQTALRLVVTRTPPKTRKAFPLASPATIAGGHAALGGLLGIQLNQSVFSGYSLAQQVAVTSHVLGHALLVRDDPGNGCSIMSPALHTGTLVPACRPAGKSNTGTYRCGANRRDGRKVARQFDGRPRRTTGYCRIDRARVQAAVGERRPGLDGGRLTVAVDIANTGGLPLVAGDVGLFAGGGFLPLTGAVAPGASGTIRYPACLTSGPAQLYSPTYDLVLGPPVTLPTPGC